MSDKLEFIHITKTGGTSIETWGNKNNFKWGHQNNEYLKKFKLKKFKRKSRWHIPSIYFETNPYIGKETFMVVRNPYTRLISEYYCPWSGCEKGNDNTIDGFNTWIINLIKNDKIVSGLPQYEYLPVDNILYFENLQNDFSNLLKKYEIYCDPNLTHENTSSTEKKFTIDDFTDETLDLIKKTYNDDFILFNYQIINK